MDIKDIRKLQLAQLDLLHEIDRVCRKNGLVYYLNGGTLLGAVRHKGFIPWDIDLDVCMMREDYEKLNKIYAKEFGEEYFLQNYDTEKEHYAGHACLCRNNSRVIFASSTIRGTVKKHEGIYIDIFPLDKVPEDVTLQEKQLKKIKKYRKIKTLKKNARNQKGFLGLKWLAHDLICLALKPFSFRYLNKKQDEIMQRYNDSESNLVASMASHYSYKKQVMPQEVYGTPIELYFEDRTYYAPADTEYYLKRIYGDYMKLPPEESRYALLNTIAGVEYPE